MRTETNFANSLDRIRDARAIAGNLEMTVMQAQPAYKESIVGAAIRHAKAVILEIENASTFAEIDEAIRRAALAEEILQAAMRS